MYFFYVVYVEKRETNCQFLLLLLSYYYYFCVYMYRYLNGASKATLKTLKLLLKNDLYAQSDYECDL